MINEWKKLQGNESRKEILSVWSFTTFRWDVYTQDAPPGGGGCVFSAPPIHYPLLRVLKFYRSRDIIGQVSPFARSSVTDRSVHWLLRVKPFVMSNGSDAVKFKLAYL